MSAALIRVVDAHKAYDGVPALQGLTMRLEAGEWVALLGPNGAGKTTLMRAIAGLVRLDAGELHVDAGDGSGGPLGLVPQELALYDELTARENLEVFGRMHRLSRGALRERVGWALAWTGLEPRADHLVSGFSGGMKRRLNIACGVLHRPSLVLLDEPAVGVDPHARDRIHEMLAQLRDEGAALLQSTHQLAEVEATCDRVVIVDDGRVVASGTPEELVAALAGRPRPFRLRLDRIVDASLSSNGYRVDGDLVHGTLHDAARELPELLRRVAGMGAQVRDLHVQSPGLDDVFAALTGKELRE